MSRFPKLTETFVLYEIVALQRQGVDVDVYALLRQKQEIVHPEARALLPSVNFRPFLSPEILGANWSFFRRGPRRYLRTLVEALRGTWGNLNHFLGALGFFPKAVSFARSMQARGVTHVHAHFANHATLVALIVHRLTGIPYSFTAHGHDIHVDRRMLAEKMAAASFAVTISEYNRRLMLDEAPGLPPERVKIVHCGADTELFVPRPREPRTSACRIVCTGSFIWVKGHPSLIEACRLLRERGVDVRVDLVGDGPGWKDIEELIAAARLEDRVILHGPQPRAKVVEFLGAADIICQPSKVTQRGSREGIPVSLMEGMAAGLPVVASRLSGIPELVEDGVSGFLVPPADPAALADALERLAGDPDLRREFGRCGRERVLADFDLRRNAARLRGLFFGREARDEPLVSVPSSEEAVG